MDNSLSIQSKNPEISELRTFTESLYKSVSDEILEEIIRFGDSELHCISALIGGITSQEAIKLITQQYTPINNTVIYNGVYSKMQVLML